MSSTSGGLNPVITLTVLARRRTRMMRTTPSSGSTWARAKRLREGIALAHSAGARRPTAQPAAAMSGRVCVFCGSSRGNDESFVRMAEEVARAIVRAGYGIVYGGGSIGLMGILADAALRAGGEVIGVIPRALAIAEVAHDGLTELILVEGMHERKARMDEIADAFLALPGGFGTLDELFEVLSWRQLGIHGKPIGLLDHNSYYQPLMAQLDAMAGAGFLSPENRSLVVSSSSIDDLLPLIGVTPL